MLRKQDLENCLPVRGYLTPWLLGAFLVVLLSLVVGNPARQELRVLFMTTAPCLALLLVWVDGKNLVQWWRRNIIGYKLVVYRHPTHGLHPVISYRPSAEFLKAVDPRGVVLVVPLGGWFHHGRVLTNQYVADRINLRMVGAFPYCRQVELSDDGGKITCCSLEMALNIVENICDHHDLGEVPGISGVMHWLLGEAKMHNATTTRQLLSTIMTAADELADTSRVGKSKEGKRIREELDRVTLEFVAHGGRVHERVSRRLES